VKPANCTTIVARARSGRMAQGEGAYCVVSHWSRAFRSLVSGEPIFLSPLASLPGTRHPSVKDRWATLARFGLALEVTASTWLLAFSSHARFLTTLSHASGHRRCHFTGVPPQPNSPSGNCPQKTHGAPRRANPGGLTVYCSTGALQRVWGAVLVGGAGSRSENWQLASAEPSRKRAQPRSPVVPTPDTLCS